MACACRASFTQMCTRACSYLSHAHALTCSRAHTHTLTTHRSYLHTRCVGARTHAYALHGVRSTGLPYTGAPCIIHCGTGTPVPAPAPGGPLPAGPLGFGSGSVRVRAPGFRAGRRAGEGVVDTQLTWPRPPTPGRRPRPCPLGYPYMYSYTQALVYTTRFDSV